LQTDHDDGLIPQSIVKWKEISTHTNWKDRNIVNNNIFNGIKLVFTLVEILIGSGLFGPDLKLLNVTVFQSQIEARIKSRGCLETIQWLKAIRLNLYTFLAGSPHAIPFHSTYPSGLSKFWKELRRPLESKDTNAIRLALTILQCSRVIAGWKPVDLSTVTDESKADQSVIVDFNQWVSKNCPSFLRNGNISWKGPHLTNKMGPSGRAI